MCNMEWSVETPASDGGGRAQMTEFEGSWPISSEGGG